MFTSATVPSLCSQLCGWLRWLRLWRQRLEPPWHTHQGPQSHWVWCVNHRQLHCHPAISPRHRPTAQSSRPVCSRWRKTDCQLYHSWPQTGGELHRLPRRCILFRNKKLGTLQRTLGPPHHHYQSDVLKTPLLDSEGIVFTASCLFFHKFLK